MKRDSVCVYASKFLSGDDLIFELTTPSESVPSAATKTFHYAAH